MNTKEVRSRLETEDVSNDEVWSLLHQALDALDKVPPGVPEDTLVLRVSPAAASALTRLKTEMSSTSEAQIMTRALSVLALLVAETGKGGRVYLEPAPAQHANEVSADALCLNSLFTFWVPYEHS